MKILLVRSNEQPISADVPHELAVLQGIVGGRIEIVEPYTENVVIVCNESGRIDGMPVNRKINDSIDICGDFFLCGHDGAGLTDTICQRI